MTLGRQGQEVVLVQAGVLSHITSWDYTREVFTQETGQSSALLVNASYGFGKSLCSDTSPNPNTSHFEERRKQARHGSSCLQSQCAGG